MILSLPVAQTRWVHGGPAIVFNQHPDENGAVVFRRACKLVFEGIVSKRLNAPYRPRPSRRFLLTFGDASRPPVGAVIIEAPSMFQARVTAVVRRLARGVPFGEGLELSAKMMTAISPEEIGRTISGKEAARLILRLVEGHGRPGE